MINRKFLMVATTILLLSMMLIVATDYSIRLVSDTNNTILTINNLSEDKTHFYNVSLNINVTGNGQVYNISQINITLPDGFVLGPIEGAKNSVNSSFTNLLNNFTFANTSNHLSWTNFTGNLLANSSMSFINNASIWFNATASKPGYYNITIVIVTPDISANATAFSIFASNISVHVNDTTKPQVYPANITISSLTHDYNDFQLGDGGNYSGYIILNLSLYDNVGNDDFNGTIYFNITRGTVRYPLNANQNVSIFNVSRFVTNSTYWNTTINTSLFSDGAYNITLIVNDSNNNINNSASIQINIDNTAPSVTLTSSSSTSNSLTLTITKSDALSGTYGTCTSSRGNAVISGSTLTESGLSCATSYSYVVTCLDKALNSGTSTSTSFTTASCGGSAGTSSGGATASTANTWTNTESITTTQFTEGVTRQMSQKARVKFTVAGAEHQVGVRTITANKVTIEIASDPVNITLEAGQDAKVDVNKDGTYDVYVKLNSITTSGKADLLVKSISEPVPESVSSGVDTSGTIGEDTGTTTPEITEESSNTTLWIIIAIIIILIASGIGYAYSKKK